MGLENRTEECDIDSADLTQKRMAGSFEVNNFIFVPLKQTYFVKNKSTHQRLLLNAIE